MKDMLAALEKLRIQFAECEMACNLATEPGQRALFANLAGHFKAMAAEVERAMADARRRDTFLGRKPKKPFPKGEE